MRDRPALPVPDDPREWGAMRPYRGRRSFDILDPVLEPFWSGQRAFAHLETELDAEPGRDAASVALLDEFGADVGAELPELTRALAQGILAIDAIVDGIVSAQVGLDGVGTAPIPELRRGPAGMVLRSSSDVDIVPRGGGGDAPGTTADDSGAPDALGFIAVDLLRVDGTSLLDVPLLERKRLLESVILPGPLVRLSVHVQPPIDPWLATWKSMGLRGAMLKAANSRYRPGDDTIEWRIVERLAHRR